MTSLFLTFTASFIMTGETDMAWKRQRIREICIGMEINGYLPAEIWPPSRLQLYCDCNGKPTPHTSPLMLPMAQPDKQQE